MDMILMKTETDLFLLDSSTWFYTCIDIEEMFVFIISNSEISIFTPKNGWIFSGVIF